MKANPQILYIDANEFNQRLVHKILGPAGFVIVKAKDGLQGIRMASDLKPDLILLDMDLPSLDGLGVTTKIKSIQTLEKIPIVILTADTTKRDRERALVAGCNGTITKPINAEHFASQIRTYLEGKREFSDAKDRTKLLRDFNLKLIDQLQAKVEELENANKELVNSKEEVQIAYHQSQEMNRELKQVNKLKENIVTITSHELRTPLSIATGYIDLLLEECVGELNPEQYQALQITGQSLQKMRELIDQITDLNRLALNKFPLNLEELDLNEVFMKVYHDLAFFMKIRNLTLRDNLSKEPVVVLADCNLISQVFSNLLKNAICFTPDQGKIIVSTHVDGNKAYFEIEDTGVGFPKEYQDRIFDEFCQVQDITHHKTGHFEFMTRGVGVGLALCKGILSELGGRITARSAGPGKGSTFTFYLPMVNK